MEEIDIFPDKYWHCHVELAGDSKKKDRSAVFNDLTFDELSQQIITPWHSGRAFTVDGMVIKNIDDIQKIKITNTPQPKSHYAEQHNYRMRGSGIADLATDRRLLPLSSGKDYTHDLLFKEQEIKNTKGSVISGNSNNVFIVHGHDEQAKESSARFIEKLGLNAVILHEQANEGQTIIEKLEKHTDAAYAVVLFTPDDVGASSASPGNLQPRARQNVLVELGYMAAKIGRNRVCVLRKGNVEIPSDFLGVLYIDIDAAGAWRLTLAKELKVAGLKVDLNEAM
ncbi:putative nucleotide-binding protein containing TIR-like domain protein [Pseudomonas saudimassiliensis]|uniref:Putative nucleotide-binding protein containing TIR-like domain protein n=1 Tax=Pseudomonas saudimassiliensis TaxID=1461581 RepID=A0A078M717_9PSED|nr:nucleotide-binding protein [Pseudomonas saudimassiliensis]CEA00501.1 putative nucleotide-binding protein containing TIR-like domain protein [Pseudomonas saudimassiliensis]CEF25175.1 putative nucleotide-binding protein containing TIR-like domain protein [Pseudomonas saudimassiliensis]